MKESIRNKELKEYFEKRFGRESARANGTILGYATGYYVVAAILCYLMIHPDKNGKPIKLTKLAKYATPRPLRVRKSDGLRYYRMLCYAEDSGILTIESRRQLWNGSIAVIVKLNPDAKLSDYEVKWPVPSERGPHLLTKLFGENYKSVVGDDIEELEKVLEEDKNAFWNDGWTEYDARFIYKGIYRMLLGAAMDRKDKKREKEVEANYNKLYPMLDMIEQECEILLRTIKKMEQ